MATQLELAEHLDLNQSTVSKLKNKGVLPSPARRGGFDLDACRLAYIRHLRTGAAGRDSTKPGSLEAERARLASAQAEAVERKNAIERGELGVRHDMIAGGHTVIAAAVARLQQVGARVSLGDPKLRKRVEAAIEDVLSDLSMVRIMHEVDGDFTDQGEDDD